METYRSLISKIYKNGGTMNKIIITIIAISMLYPASNTVDVNSKQKKPTFIDKIETKDPDAKAEIDQLKEEFEEQREQIREKYEMKRQTLKKQQKQELENLRDAYKNKIKRLQRKYPKKIHEKSRKHVKPLDKKDSKYLDPRESDKNSELKKEKESNLDSDQPIKIKRKPRKTKKPEKIQK